MPIPIEHECPIRFEDGKLTKNTEDKFTVSSTYLKTVFSPKICPSRVCQFYINDIKNSVKDIKLEIYPGRDGISAKMIKEMLFSMQYYVKVIFHYRGKDR